jgi:hypothetical protein
MICGEAVKPSQYAVEALRKQVLLRIGLSAQIRGKKFSKKQMRPGPATPAASLVDLSPCLPAARSGEPTVLVRQRSPKKEERRIYQYWPQSMIPEYDSQNRFSATPALASGPARSRSRL